MISKVRPAGFATFFSMARIQNDQIDRATSPYDYDAETAHYLEITPDGLPDGHLTACGYAVRKDGELVYVFSTEPGRGNDLVESALSNGAVYLDCFDGYLPTLYARHGFVEVSRVKNWNPDGPDVVYMALPGFEDRHGV